MHLHAVVASMVLGAAVAIPAPHHHQSHSNSFSVSQKATYRRGGQGKAQDGRVALKNTLSKYGGSVPDWLTDLTNTLNQNGIDLGDVLSGNGIPNGNGNGNSNGNGNGNGNGQTSSTVAPPTASPSNASKAGPGPQSGGNSQSGAPPTDSGSASGGDEKGEVTVNPEQGDVEYLSPIRIGGQEVVVNIDTGSSDTWVFNTYMPAQDTQGHETYDPSKSTTGSALPGETFQIQYGDGSKVSGNVTRETVDVGGASVTGQAVGLGLYVSGSFQTDVASDGVLGLGFDSLNSMTPTKQKTFFENIQSGLEEPVFTAALKHNAPGSYAFGQIDHSLYTGNLAYTPVDKSDGHWTFTPQAINIGGRDVNNGAPGVVDTGTSLIMMADDIVTAYYAPVQGAQFDQQQGGYTFPCATKLPDFPVQITSEYKAVVSGALLNYNQVDSQTCYGGVQSSGNTGVNIFGDPLLKAQFVVFDIGQLRLGFAPQA